MANLIVLNAGDVTTHDLTDETIIGRHPECQVHVESNMVSRKHARIVRDGMRFFVEDMGSGNGTTVNGQRITERTLLHHEDRIKLGPVLLRFEDATAIRAAAAAAPPKPSLDSDSFGFEMASEANDTATIVGALDQARGARFGTLDANPAAKLRGILEISRTLAGTVDLDTLLPRILETLFSIFPAADRGCIVLKNPVTGEMIPRAIRHRRSDEDDSVKLSRTIVNKVLAEKTGVLSADATSDSRFTASESISNFTIRSMMCVPLLGLDGEPLGIINIDTQNPIQQFKTDDLDLLMAVAGQAALSYENARLVATYLEKQKQDSEMQIAANVQRALLPEKLPEVPGYQFYASYESAQAVGGDYYDCLVLPGDRVCLAFGDVAGKGVPASLVMSRLSSVVQNTLEFVTEAGEAVRRINDHMCANAIEGRFVTFVLTMIDLRSNELSVVIAGHMSPMIRLADGTIEEFPEDSVGLPLGIVNGMEFEVNRRVLAPGETVVIYTDGISEAMDPSNELYGLERLRDKICHTVGGADVVGSAILTDVKRHAGGREQNDDITLMAVSRPATL